MLGEIWNIQKTPFENFANNSILSAHGSIIMKSLFINQTKITSNQ